MTTPADGEVVASVTPLPRRPPPGEAVGLELGALDDPRVLAAGRIPAGSRVVDLGTGDGALPATLRRTGCEVRAVEVDPVLAGSARRHCDQVVVADLESLDLAGAFGRGSADVVVALDVLGWVRDPAALLRRAADDLLAPGGWIVVSLPNVAHASVRLGLLTGRFGPGSPLSGGRVPLRLFDASAAGELLADAGLVPLCTERALRPLGPADAELAAGDRDLLERLVADPESLTTAYVVTAVPAGSPRVDDPPLLPAAAAQSAALRERARAERLAARLAELEPLAADRDGVLSRLEAMRTASLERRRVLRDLLVMLQDNLTRMHEALPARNDRA